MEKMKQRPLGNHVMMIVPELETNVVIFVPRTGSSSLRRALAAKYPQSFLLYRHMEADGVPFGYDRWQRLGVVRSPIDRLWSLYNYQKSVRPYSDPVGGESANDDGYFASQHAAAARPFDDWIVNNRVLFSKQYDLVNYKAYWPVYSMRHLLPENMKSQFIYLRPDLGTEIYNFDELQ